MSLRSSGLRLLSPASAYVYANSSCEQLFRRCCRAISMFQSDRCSNGIDAGKVMDEQSAAAADEPAIDDAGDFVVGKRIGSFTDLATANRLVNATLLRNRDRVDRVAEGKSSLEELDAIFEELTGKEAFAPDERTDPRIRLTWGVRVVIVHDLRTWRQYHVITAFPRNFDPYPEPSKFSMEIYRSGGVEVTYDWKTAENFAQATEFLKQLAGGPSSPDPKNPQKPRFYYFEHKRQNDALDAFIRKLRSWPL